MQGFVNHVFWQGLVPLLGMETALKWPMKLKQIPKNYHGRVFEGNACRVMLKNADILFDPEILQDCPPLKVMPFVSSLKCMNRIVQDCFSSKQPSDNLP